MDATLPQAGSGQVAAGSPPKKRAPAFHHWHATACLVPLVSRSCYHEFREPGTDLIYSHKLGVTSSRPWWIGEGLAQIQRAAEKLSRNGQPARTGNRPSGPAGPTRRWNGADAPTELVNW